MYVVIDITKRLKVKLIITLDVHYLCTCTRVYVHSVCTYNIYIYIYAILQYSIHIYVIFNILFQWYYISKLWVT